MTLIEVPILELQSRNQSNKYLRIKGYLQAADMSTSVVSHL